MKWIWIIVWSEALICSFNVMDSCNVMKCKSEKSDEISRSR
jgi:hypothetical protein